MIQLNLLPDVKKEYIKTNRTKRLILNASSLVVVTSLVTTVLLMLYVQVLQKNRISSLTDNISKNISDINSIKDLDKILTIQNQLKELPTLHENKPETSRLFGFLNQLTPPTVSISEVKLQFEDKKLLISGTANSLASVNKYVDTLKFATYTTDNAEDGIPFIDVVSQLNRTEKSVSYTLKMNFDEMIFNNTENVRLIIPNKITTRSVLGAPIFSQDNTKLFDNTNGGQ